MNFINPTIKKLMKFMTFMIFILLFFLAATVLYANCFKAYDMTLGSSIRNSCPSFLSDNQIQICDLTLFILLEYVYLPL